MYQDQRQADGQTGKIAGSVLLGGGAQHHEYEDKSKYDLGDQSRDELPLGKTVGSRRFDDRIPTVCEGIENSRANDPADDLCRHVTQCFAGFHPAGKPYSERDGRVDVASRHRPDGISHGDDRKSEGKGNGQYRSYSGRATVHHGSAAAHQHQYHGAESL